MFNGTKEVKKLTLEIVFVSIYSWEIFSYLKKTIDKQKEIFFSERISCKERRLRFPVPLLTDY